MKRAAIYARFSSDGDSGWSCQDQIDLCTAWAARQGLTVVASYADRSAPRMPASESLEFGRLQRDARNRAFDVVIAEAPERLGHDGTALDGIRQQLATQEVALLTVHDAGAAPLPPHDDMQRATLAQQTRRGLRARVDAGASAGGRSYGYDPVPGRRGQLAINRREAKIVVRIFELYAAGTTPRAIAATLNAERIPGPRGGRWNASTINGSRARQNGIIANPLYAGETIWNRQRFVTDKVTGKRVSRPNPPEDWVRVQTPHLQIVDFDLYLRANAIKARKGAVRAEQSRAPRHPLSGLLECTCGASFIVTGTNRLGCSRHRESGDCDNATTLTPAEVERRVLATLEAQLRDPDAIAARIRSDHADRNRLAREAEAARRADEERAIEIGAALERIVDRIVAGTAPQALLARMDALEAERKLIEARLAVALPDEPVRLHPGIAEHYRQAALHLRDHLARPRTEANVAELSARFRECVERIVIGPRKDKGPAPITVYGALEDLLTSETLVAGTGFEPVTFRL